MKKERTKNSKYIKKRNFRFLTPLSFLIFYQVILTLMFFIFRMNYLYFLSSVGMIFQLPFDMIFFTIFVILPIYIILKYRSDFKKIFNRRSSVVIIVICFILTYKVFLAFFGFIFFMIIWFLLSVCYSPPKFILYLIMIFILYIIFNLTTMLVIKSNAKKNKKILLLFLLTLLGGLGIKCFESTYDISEIPIKKGENLSEWELYSIVNDRVPGESMALESGNREMNMYDYSELIEVNTNKKGKYPILYFRSGKREHVLAVYKVE